MKVILRSIFTFYTFLIGPKVVIALIIFQMIATNDLIGQVEKTPPSSDFIYDGCGCLGTINFEIYNGLEGDFGDQKLANGLIK